MVDLLILATPLALIHSVGGVGAVEDDLAAVGPEEIGLDGLRGDSDEVLS